MTRISTGLALATATALLAVSSALAGEIVPGLPPFGSLSGGPFDKVDNANLNVHFAIPVLAKAGRGLSFNYLRRYDSSIWKLSAGTAWVPRYKWGWSGVTEGLLGMVTYWITQGS